MGKSLFTLLHNIIKLIVLVCTCQKHTQKMINYEDQDKKKDKKRGGKAKDETENKRIVLKYL